MLARNKAASEILLSLLHFPRFMRDGEAGDIVAIVAEMEPFPSAENDHTDIELSATAFAGIRFFEFVLLFVSAFFESLHDRSLVGFALSERFVGVGTLDRFVGFSLRSNVFLDVFDRLYVLSGSDDKSLRHSCDKVFIGSPVREMGFFVMLKDSIRI